MSSITILALPNGGNRPNALFSNSFTIIAALSLAATLALILIPLGGVFARSFIVDGHITARPFLDAVSHPSTVRVLADTLAVVAASTVGAVVLGCVFAWLNERTDARISAAANILPLIPLVMPQIAGVIGWVILLSPQAGYINALLREVLGNAGISLDDGPLNIFSYGGLIGVMTLYLVPFVYLIVSAALQQINPSLEEAARLSGASPLRTLFRVTLPAVRPAIVNASIIVLIFAVSFFSVPVIIGTGAGIDLLSVRIYRLLYAYPSQLEMAVSLSIFMMIFVQIALVIQVLSGRLTRHSVVSGKAHSVSRVSLGRWRPAAMAIVAVYLVLVAVLPLAALAISSIQPFWTPRIDVSYFTLNNFYYVLSEDRIIVKGLVNSVSLGIIGATLGMILAAVLVVYSKEAGVKKQGLVDVVTALPATLPHTVIAVAMIVTFTGGKFSLHGTLTLLFMAYLLISLPQAMRSARAAGDQVGKDLVEAARIAGANKLRVFSRVVFPIMLPGLVAGWVILFVYISGELTASALLSSTNNPVVGLVLLNLWENGSFPQLSAIALVMTAISAGVVLAVMKLFRIQTSVA